MLILHTYSPHPRWRNHFIFNVTDATETGQLSGGHVVSPPLRRAHVGIEFASLKVPGRIYRLELDRMDLLDVVVEYNAVCAHAGEFPLVVLKGGGSANAGGGA